VTVRDERSEDIAEIRNLVTSAFGRKDEATLVDELRDADDTVISLVAVENGRIVGHIALSKMVAPFATLALAPISVIPERQHDGIGSELILEAIGRARDVWTAIFVLGSPDFYGRFGFDARLATGVLVHAPAFGNLS
jgi:putative acetyltransferase